MYTQPMCLVDVQLRNEEGRKYASDKERTTGIGFYLDPKDKTVLRLRDQFEGPVYISVLIDDVQVIPEFYIFSMLIYDERENSVPFSTHSSIRHLGRENALPFDRSKTKENPATITILTGKKSQEHTDTLTIEYYY